MSTPQGWYDDGFGQMRWWDGAQWTQHVAAAPNNVAAPAAAPNNVAAPAAVPVSPAASASPAARSTPTLGFVGLGLAVVGTALAVIPTLLDANGFVMLTAFGFGMLLLLAAFIVSMIGVFRKNVVKWPSGTGTGLSVVGGVAATTLFLAAILGGGSGTQTPESISTQSPESDDSTSATTTRPSAEEISAVFEEAVHPEENQIYGDFLFECIGEDLYESDLSDEDLQKVIAIDDAEMLKQFVEENPKCSKEISVIVAGDIHGTGKEISLGSGLTVQITVSPAQFRDAEPILPGQPVTQSDYDYSWGDAVETDGQIAVVKLTVRNNGDATRSDNGALFNLLDPSGEAIIGSTGLFDVLDYPSDPFGIDDVAPGEEKTYTETYAVSAADIDQTTARLYLIRNMGEGNGFIIE